MDKIYLYKTANKSVAYDEEHWYIDNIPQQQNDGDGISLFKEYAVSEAYRLIASDIRKYTCHFKNVAVLTAAGTSMENGEHRGKTRTELWESYEEEINAISSVLTNNDGTLKEKCLSIVESKNIEEFLSFTILYEKLNGEIKDAEDNSLRCKLEKKIADACRLTLDENNRHHQDFIRKLTARKPTEPRVQLYTTNYDTLFEQAATKLGFTVIDGFSFSHPRIFNGTNFDYDIVYRERSRIKPDESFVPNVFQLYKIHGSIDWQRGKNGEIIQVEKTDTPCVIYPASNKYESSYEQPYIEMIAHFQQTLRKEGTLLIVAGFGFKDKHIQNVIKEAVSQNPYFHLLVVCYNGSGITNELVPDFLTADLKPLANVTILHSKFKDFVEHYPFNMSYNTLDNSFYPHATV